MHKSKMFYSEYITERIARRISKRTGIALTRDIGKYLGVPLLHDRRITKNTCANSLDKVKSRLVGYGRENV